MLRTGRMRRRVTLQTSTSVPDGMGGSTETPLAIAENVWARIEPLDGSEKIEAMQTGMQRPYMITLRYRADLTGATTLLYDGRTFDIKSIADPEERHRELHLLADEVNA